MNNFINKLIDEIIKATKEKVELSGNLLDNNNEKRLKGILIGDYKIKKIREGQPMQRDSYIKLPKKGTNEGAL